MNRGVLNCTLFSYDGVEALEELTDISATPSVPWMHWLHWRCSGSCPGTWIDADWKKCSSRLPGCARMSSIGSSNGYYCHWGSAVNAPMLFRLMPWISEWNWQDECKSTGQRNSLPAWARRRGMGNNDGYYSYCGSAMDPSASMVLLRLLPWITEWSWPYSTASARTSWM